MAKYIAVEKALEYNDEYYMIGEGYNIKSKLYNTYEEAEEAIEDLIIGLFTDFEGNFNSSYFNFQEFDYSSCESIKQYFDKKGYPYNDDYEICLPPYLYKEEVIEAYNNWNVSLFEVIKIEE